MPGHRACHALCRFGYDGTDSLLEMHSFFRMLARLYLLHHIASQTTVRAQTLVGPLTRPGGRGHHHHHRHGWDQDHLIPFNPPRRPDPTRLFAPRCAERYAATRWVSTGAPALPPRRRCVGSWDRLKGQRAPRSTGQIHFFLPRLGTESPLYSSKCFKS